MKKRKNTTKTARSPLRKIKPTAKTIVSKRKRPTTRAKKAGIKRKTPISYRPPQVVLDANQRAQAFKYETAAAVKEKTQEPFRLPFRYNDDRIMAMTRDPWWLHVYWDISDKRERQVLATIPNDEKQGLKRILRVYDVSGVKDFTGFNARGFFDIEINDLAANWYINVDRPDTSFCVDIGFRSLKGNFYLLARSNVTKTPCFGISSILDEEWYLADDEYFKMLGIYDLGKSSLERRRKFEELFRKQVSSLGASEAFSPMYKKRARKFFLEAHTELILYGKTESDAKVTLKGKKIKLKKDGTFSFRFALPEGKFEFPIEATSSSGKDRLNITPVVERSKK